MRKISCFIVHASCREEFKILDSIRGFFLDPIVSILIFLKDFNFFQYLGDRSDFLGFFVFQIVGDRFYMNTVYEELQRLTV